MKKIASIFSVLIIFSCQNSGEIKDLKTENDKLKSENVHLKNTILNLDDKVAIIEKKSEKTDLEKQQNITVQNSIIYYFIVLEVTEKLFTSSGEIPGKKLYYTSEVSETENYDEQIKYKLLDGAVKSYNRDGTIKHRTILNNREIFTYETYQEASEAREQYIMKNN